MIASGGVVRKRGYDEPHAMAAWLVSRGVKPDDVVVDEGGHRTSATMADAAALGVRSALIVTQGYHLPRSIYFARHVGIDALGVPAPPRRWRSRTTGPGSSFARPPRGRGRARGGGAWGEVNQDPALQMRQALVRKPGMRRASFTLPIAIPVALLSFACVEQDDDKPTEDDMKAAQENILTTAPTPKYAVNADLDGKLVYLGLDVDTGTVEPGKASR